MPENMPAPTPAPTIDAHHHLWRYTTHEFDWLEGPLAGLRRDFALHDLEAAMRSAGVDGAVAVQARQTLDETRFLLAEARRSDAIRGVVGWAPLAAPDVARTLETLCADPLLKGLRHVVQGEADGFLARADFNRGLEALRGDALCGRNLVYDILILERQLAEATALVDRHPGQSFVLDHLAKPRIAAAELEPWRTHLRELARRPNVACKLSGMVTEANPTAWTPAALRPYLDTAVDAFGPGRLLAASDWPVCLAGVSYSGWFDLLRDFFAPFTSAEQEAVFGGNAVRIYNLW